MNFLAPQVATGFLVGHPRRQGFLLEALEGLLLHGVLLSGFKHEPVRRTPALCHQMLGMAFSASPILKDAAMAASYFIRSC